MKINTPSLFVCGTHVLFYLLLFLGIEKYHVYPHDWLDAKEDKQILNTVNSYLIFRGPFSGEQAEISFWKYLESVIQRPLISLNTTSGRDSFYESAESSHLLVFKDKGKEIIYALPKRKEWLPKAVLILVVIGFFGSPFLSKT